MFPNDPDRGQHQGIGAQYRIESRKWDYQIENRLIMLKECEKQENGSGLTWEMIAQTHQQEFPDFDYSVIDRCERYCTKIMGPSGKKHQARGLPSAGIGYWSGPTMASGSSIEYQTHAATQAPSQYPAASQLHHMQNFQTSSPYKQDPEPGPTAQPQIPLLYLGDWQIQLEDFQTLAPGYQDPESWPIEQPPTGLPLASSNNLPIYHGCAWVDGFYIQSLPQYCEIDKTFPVVECLPLLPQGTPFWFPESDMEELANALRQRELFGYWELPADAVPSPGSSIPDGYVTVFTFKSFQFLIHPLPTDPAHRQMNIK